MSLRERLRTETRRLHEQVEAVVDIPRRLASRQAYGDYLGRLYGLVQAVEIVLNQPDLAWPGLAAFKRAELIAADLQALGISTAALPAPDLLPVATAAEALGMRYGLEGSALGGRLIFRQHSAELGLTAEQGGRYLAGTDEVVINWRQLVAALDAIPAEGETAELALRGAVWTFELFGEWFGAA